MMSCSRFHPFAGRRNSLSEYIEVSLLCSFLELFAFAQPDLSSDRFSTQDHLGSFSVGLRVFAVVSLLRALLPYEVYVLIIKE